MRKFWLILVLAVMLLTACTSKTPTAAPTAAATTAPVSNSLTDDVEDCTVASTFPEPKAPLNVTVPRASDKDWSLGASDARMVIIEYSDYQ